MHNENKFDEIGKILDHYMTLVPTLNAEQKLILPNSDALAVDNTQFHAILFCGDQLTVARMCGTQGTTRHTTEL